MIYLLDDEGEIKEEAENTDYCNFSQGESFQAAFSYKSQIAVITADTCGNGWLTLFDENLDRTEKRLLFSDSMIWWWGIKKVQGGYLIDSAIAGTEDDSAGDTGNNETNTASGKLILLDEDFEYVTTATREGTYTNQFYQDRISFYLDNRLFFRQDIKAYGSNTLCYTNSFSLSGEENTTAQSVTLADGQLDVDLYETYRMGIKSEQVFVNQTITWISGDSSVVSVGAGGMITANRPGSAVITMKCGEYTSSCVVTVNEIEKERIDYPISQYQDTLIAWLEGDTLTIEIADLYKGALVEMPDFNLLPIWYDDKDKIKHVVIGEGIISIGKYAFLDCENLKSVTFPDSLQSIELYAFDNSGIEELDIPAGVTYIGTELNQCPKLKTLNIDPENKSYVFENGILYNYSKTRLIGCCVSTKGCITIPDTVKTVQKNAFYGCKLITGVQISKNMSTIPSFEGCRQLKELFVPESVKQLPISVIYNSCLSNIVIQGMDTKITESGFSHTQDEDFHGITDCIIYAYTGSSAESFMTTDYLTGIYQEMESELGISLNYMSLNQNQTNLQQLQIHPDSSCEIQTADDIQYLKGISEKTTVEELLENLNNPDSLISVYDENGNKVRDGKQVIGTGYSVKTFSDTAAIVIKGDVDGDGMINVLDMEEIQKKLLGISALDKINEMAARICNEDSISVLDMEAVQKHILKSQNIRLTDCIL